MMDKLKKLEKLQEKKNEKKKMKQKQEQHEMLTLMTVFAENVRMKSNQYNVTLKPSVRLRLHLRPQSAETLQYNLFGDKSLM